ncbi:MAG: LysM peptidoglycan-binding domain-containing protein [Myxococcota bacterium]
MGVTSGGKAYFENADRRGQKFFVQFNPKELKLEDTASWKSSDEQGKPQPLLTYEKGEAAALTMDLIFDTTDQGGASIQPRIDALRAFLNTSIPVQNAGGQSKRPPYIDFHWKSFSFQGVCEKVAASILMFKADGTPVRAKVTVTLKERQVESGNGSTSISAGSGVTLSSMGTMFSGAGVSATTTTVGPNQTLSQAAAAANTDVRTLAKANPQISDPMNVPAGTQLVVPGNPQLAQVLANQALGQSPANFAPDGDLNPFSQGGAGPLGGLDNLAGMDNDLSAFSSSGLAQKALPIVDKAAEKAHEVVGKVEEKAQGVASKVIDQAAGVADKVGLGSQVSGLKDDAAEAISGGANEAHDGIDTAQEAAHDALGDPDFEAPDRN